jgi:hypothetical protein
MKLTLPVGTTNSLALSPDAKSVFVVNLVRRHVAIQRISVATGKVSFIAYGFNPAVSPDGRYLAYAAENAVAVRNLRSGRTMIVNVSPLLHDSSLLTTGQGLAWLGDGTQVVAIPQPLPTLEGVAPQRQVSAGTACRRRSPAGGTCLIVVDVRSDGLRAHSVIAPLPLPPRLVISGMAASSHTLLLDGWYQGKCLCGSTIYAINLTADQAAAHRLVRMPAKSWLWAIAPAGEQVLYGGGSPAGYWVATIRGGRLINQHRLNVPRRFGFDEAAW